MTVIKILSRKFIQTNKTYHSNPCGLYALLYIHRNIHLYHKYSHCQCHCHWLCFRIKQLFTQPFVSVVLCVLQLCIYLCNVCLILRACFIGDGHKLDKYFNDKDMQCWELDDICFNMYLYCVYTKLRCTMYCTLLLRNNGWKYYLGVPRSWLTLALSQL